ncbi:MAG: N-acetyltransferase [Gemmatimonadetes bacterium]|uniref:N-acetyltransferase n=1 Tax=Candidatus Kutchimonas denitrificans TaxID=3056748 RepID=A0AAE4ZBQ8_9BACT|nr:N-acetyltransferase [Gemmatimonadota bacterium]NIR76387.1 N-acetyltransferase [Candidatus Kutchimonas denitrificans]NIS03197.1 N-acetyltransferase [Gemmatimonadota bacterium]NIT66370.1 N-acetyltransferase [Gemmatimonadota bacterium]NIU54449.1 GNAT family N-acetyltransferase [Gemmatimonadota bacterium]
MDPRDYSADETLRDGERVHIRAIVPDDKAGIVDLFNRLSPETRYFRFLGAKTCLTDAELVYLTELDFVRQAALVAELTPDGSPRIVGVARYAAPPADPLARPEVALAVDDQEQGRGIGTLLLTHLARLAAAQGITEFDAYLLAENERMLSLFRRCGFEIDGAVDGNVMRLVLTVPGSSRDR